MSYYVASAIILNWLTTKTKHFYWLFSIYEQQTDKQTTRQISIPVFLCQGINLI